LAGRWRIVEMSGWDRDAIELVEPGFIEFSEDGTGRFGLIAVRGRLDEGDQVSGRGWASIVDGAMTTRVSGQNISPTDRLDGQ